MTNPFNTFSTNAFKNAFNAAYQVLEEQVEKKKTNNTKEEVNMVEDAVTGVFKAQSTGKGVFASIKHKVFHAIDVVKNVTVDLYKKGKGFFLDSKIGRRITKLGIAMGTVALAGTMTHGIWTCGLLAWSIFGIVRGSHALFTGTVDWSIKTAVFNSVKDLVYVGSALAFYVYATPYLMNWFIDGTVWVLNELISVWSTIGFAIVG